MKYLFSILLISLLFSNKVYSCGNEYGHSLNGEEIHTKFFYLIESMYTLDEVEIKKRLRALNKTIQEKKDTYRTWSDVALNLMKLGDLDSSLTLLRSLLLEHPNEYNINANLGTVYELKMELDSALKYISKGLQIKSNSHFHSEWIHVKILEAKIQEKKTPGWLNKNSIIELNTLLKEVKSTGKNNRDVFHINNEFFLQIRTRVPFTPPPNKVIANLLITLGDFNIKAGTYENAILAYAYALKFVENRNKLSRTKWETRIYDKISKLNELRDQSKENIEVSQLFLRLYNRGKLNMNLLTFGLDEIAEKLDSINNSERIQTDSIAHLNMKLDSMENLVENTTESTEEEKESDSIFTSFYGILFGIGFGAILVIIIDKRKRR